MKIYLASSSPRRKELLEWMGLRFEAIEHGVDEGRVKIDEGEALVAELAMRKVIAATEKVRGLIIGSDLVIDLKREQLGKPKDLSEARKMLRQLRGRVHQVICGVAVVETGKDEGLMSVDKTKVKMKNYSDKIIERYIKEFEVLDKGGSYSIRYKLKGYGSLVEKHEGAVTTVLGLPLHYLENLLKEFGVKVKQDWRKKCLKETGYEY